VGVGWCLTALLDSVSIANQALLAGALFMTFIGPAIVFGPAVVGASGFESLSTWGITAVAAVFTVLSAFFYTYNLDLLERLPKLGPRLRHLRANTRRTLEERPWIRRWATFGVGFFVFLPIPGSGTLGGSLMGRLVGLTRLATFAAVTVAGLVVTGLYGLLGEELRLFGERHALTTPVKVAGALGLVLLFVLLGRWIARQGKRADAAGRAK
jgi:uncharacterized membrane protein